MLTKKLSVGAVEVAACGVGQNVRLSGDETDGDETVMKGLKMAKNLKEEEVQRVSGGIFNHPGPT